LARNSNGCTDAVLVTRGFEREILAKLAFDGLVKFQAHETVAGSRPLRAVWLQITEAGRKASARQS
jgi:hypothetical protein